MSLQDTNPNIGWRKGSKKSQPIGSQPMEKLRLGGNCKKEAYLYLRSNYLLIVSLRCKQYEAITMESVCPQGHEPTTENMQFEKPNWSKVGLSQ